MRALDPRPMDARSRADQAHAYLEQARNARQRGDSASTLGSLHQAVQVLDPEDQAPLHARAGWRLAKAAFDFHDLGYLGIALDHLLVNELALDDPSALRALPRLSQRWWDTAGYRDPRLSTLWQAWSTRRQEQGDPWLAATGHAHLAWSLACTGQLDALDDLTEHILSLDPRRFGDGPHRHPDAPDTRSSVWWAQLELLRPSLWSTAWSPRRDRARDLLDALLDAAAAADIEVASSAWDLDPAMRAAIANDLSAFVDRWAEPWIAGLRDLDHPRASFHLALAQGLLQARASQPASIEALEVAASIAEASDIGPEWQADAWCQVLRAATRLGQSSRAARAQQRAVDLISTYGLGGLRPPSPTAPKA